MIKKASGKGSISWPFFLVGVGLTAFAFYICAKAFDVGTLTNDQRFILLWLFPLASGFLCGSFAGSISAKTKKGYTGWVVAATGGFAVWILSYFLLPSPQPKDYLPNAVSVSLVKGMYFRNAAEMIAQNDNAVVEFIGFKEYDLKRKIVNTRLSGENNRTLLENLRLCVENPESFPNYIVIPKERGKYVLRIP